MKSNITNKGQFFGQMEVIYPIENMEDGDGWLLVRMLFDDDSTTMLLAIDAAKEVFSNKKYLVDRNDNDNIVELTIFLGRKLWEPRKFLRSNAQKIGEILYKKYN